MIQTEYLNNGKLVRHYSDADMMILQEETGIKYGDAIDIVPCEYAYSETDEPIDEQDPEE